MNNVVNSLNATELCKLKCCILCYVDFTTIWKISFRSEEAEAQSHTSSGFAGQWGRLARRAPWWAADRETGIQTRTFSGFGRKHSWL